MYNQADVERIYAITRADIAEMMTSSSMNRAKKYRRQGRVTTFHAAGATLTAHVRGSNNHIYEVQVTVLDGEIYADCTCPYDWGGWCKHIGAVLLEWIETRRAVDAPHPSSELDEPADSYTTDETPNTESTPSPSNQEQILDWNDLKPEFISEYQQLLSNLKIKFLRKIAQQRGIVLTAKLKNHIVDELAAKLVDLDTIKTLMTKLDDLEHRLLIFIRLSTPAGYGVPLSSIKALGTNNDPDTKQIRAKINNLAQTGLIVPFTNHRVTYYTLPQLIRLHLPACPGIVEPCDEHHIAQLDRRTQPFPVLNHKLYQVWNYIAANQPSKPASPPPDPIETQWEHLEGWTHLPQEIQEIKPRGQFFYIQRPVMTVPTPPYNLCERDRSALGAKLDSTGEEIEFYYALLSQIGAIKDAPNLQADPSKIQSLLNMSPAHQLAVLTQAWQQMVCWSELGSILRASPDLRLRRNVTYITYKPEQLHQEWREGRQAVFRFLSLLEENRWVSVDALHKVIYEVNPNLLHIISHTNVWWFESVRRKKQFGATLDDWRLSYGQMVTATLTGPLFWLGVVELGYQAGRLTAVRLTPVGAFLQRRRKTPFEQQTNTMSVDAIQFQDDMTILVAQRQAPLELYNLLNTIGQLENATPQHFAYRITANSIQRQFEQGETADTLLAALEKTCPAEIPAAWRARIQAWHNQYGKLHLYHNITLIELADEYILKELLTSALLCENLVYQFSPRLIAIRPEAVDDLVAEMEKRGYMPHVE